MTEQEYLQTVLAGQVNVLSQPQQTPTDNKDASLDILPFMAVLQALRSPKSHLSTAPTFRPKTFIDQIQFYDSGGVRRLYLYLNNSWRYVTLT